MKKLNRSGSVIATLAFLALPVNAADYNLQSAFPKNLTIIGESADYFSARLNVLTDGAIKFKHLGAGELSPPFELLDNVASGAIPAGWSYAAYAAGRAPAAALFGSIPFGPEPIKYLTWIYHGGGLELWREIYEPYNVVPMPCGVILPEAGGWFRKPVQAVEDFKGLRMRIGGLGGQVIKKLGASPQNLPVGEIFTSLETGRLDAAEMANPAMDLPLGYYKAAENYYFPGWHQPSGFIEFYVNKKIWDSWSNSQRIAIDAACRDTSLWALGKAAGAQATALDELRGKGVKIQRFPDAVLSALKKAADEVYDEASEADPMFKRVIESYRRYSTTYDEYRNLSKMD